MSNKEVPSYLEISPTPWGAWDKHAHLYDANGKGIASFNTEEDPENWPHGSKKAVDLNNRNRTAQCVNALVDTEDPDSTCLRFSLDRVVLGNCRDIRGDDVANYLREIRKDFPELSVA